MIDQIGIVLTGVVAVFLTQSQHEWLRRYACLFGLAGQPFWFYAAISAKQWGVTLVCVLYTVAWAKGVWTHWLRKSSNRPAAGSELCRSRAVLPPAPPQN